jgi:hypothetical protein
MKRATAIGGSSELRGGCRLEGEIQLMPLRRFMANAVRDRKLQYRCMLAFAQTRYGHDLTARELEGVVMHIRLILVDLPEHRDRSFDLAQAEAWKKTPEGICAFDWSVERHFRSGKKAYGNVRLSDGRETSGARVAEVCGGEFVADLCRPSCDEVKTIIAH